jgi:hypothetical protein
MSTVLVGQDLESGTLLLLLLLLLLLRWRATPAESRPEFLGMSNGDMPEVHGEQLGGRPETFLEEEHLRHASDMEAEERSST